METERHEDEGGTVLMEGGILRTRNDSSNTDPFRPLIKSGSYAFVFGFCLGLHGFLFFAVTGRKMFVCPRVCVACTAY